MSRNLVRFITLLHFFIISVNLKFKGAPVTFFFAFQVMMKRRGVAAKQKTPAVNLRGKTMIGNGGERTTRTEGSAGGRRAAATVRAARSGPEKCETRSSEATTMTAITSKRTQAEAAGRRAAEARTKAGTEEAAGAAAPPRHPATAAVGTQRGVRAEVAARGRQTPAMPVTVNKICREDKMTINLWCTFFFIPLQQGSDPQRQLSLGQNQRMIFISGTRATPF